MQKSLFDFDEPVATLPAPEPKKLKPLPTKVRARKTDPMSSHVVVDEFEPIGAQIAVLAAIQDWPDKTSRELAAELGWETGSVNKRTSELEAAGYIVAKYERRCSLSNKTAATWTAVVTKASRV